MGLSSLRRHRGGYVNRQLVQREPTKEDLVAALEAEKAKSAALQAALEAQAKAATPKSPEPAVPVVEPAETETEPATAKPSRRR